MKFSAPLSLLLLLATLPAFAAEWPQWRGPDGSGHISGSGYPTTWSEDENVAWKIELPGEGHSSPVIAGDEIWLTTAVTQPITEEARKKKLAANTGSQPLTLVGKLSMRALCVDRKTGELVKNIEVLVHDDPQWTHEINTFASPSPVLDDGKLYCSFGSHGSACLDINTGKVLWTNQELSVLHENGPGSTPVVWGDYLIEHYDGSDQQFIAALNKNTGKLAWKTERSGEMNSNPQLQKAYGTPLVVNIDGRDQVISPAADWLYSYDPATGEELWKLYYGQLGFSIVPRPVFGHDTIYFSTSFMKAQMQAVKVEDGKPRTIWTQDSGAPKIPSPILVGDELYYINDKGIATCVDAATGKLHWEKRLGGNVASSPTYADGHLYFHNREGDTYVVKPGPEFELLHTNQLDGGHWASLAGADGAFYVRTDNGLYCLRNSK